MIDNLVKEFFVCLVAFFFVLFVVFFGQAYFAQILGKPIVFGANFGNILDTAVQIVDKGLETAFLKRQGLRPVIGSPKNASLAFRTFRSA